MEQTKIRCIFMLPPLKTGMAEGFTAVNEWGWATEEDEVRKEVESVKKDFSKVRDKFKGKVEFHGWDIIHDEEDLLEKSFEIQDSDDDAVLVFMTGSTVMYSHALLTFNKPLIIFGKTYKEPVYGYNLHNKFFEWSLQRKDLGHMVSTVVDDYTWLSENIRAVRAASKLRRTKILVIGRPTKWIGGESFGKAAYEFVSKAQEEMGVKTEYISLDKFVEEFNKMEVTDEMRKMHEDFVSKAEEKREIRDEKSALGAVKCYFVLKKLIEETGANAVTVECYESALIDRIGTTPCYALAKLNDEGVVSACEGDINALINMLMTSYLADKPVFQGDPVQNERIPKIINAHCTCPTKMKGYNEESEPYVATTHYESGKGLTPQVILKEGQEITATYMDPDLNSMIITKGKITKSDMRLPICRTQIEFELSDPKKWNKVCKERLRFYSHMINVVGDYTKEVVQLCEMLGIEPVVV